MFSKTRRTLRLLSHFSLQRWWSLTHGRMYVCMLSPGQSYIDPFGFYCSKVINHLKNKTSWLWCGWYACRTAGATRIQVPSTFWFGLKSSSLGPWLRTNSWTSNTHILDGGRRAWAASDLVRHVDSCADRSRDPNWFLSASTSGMVTQQFCTILLFFSHNPSDMKKNHFFLSEPFPFPFHSSAGAQVSGVSPADRNPVSLGLNFL